MTRPQAHERDAMDGKQDDTSEFTIAPVRGDEDAGPDGRLRIGIIGLGAIGRHVLSDLTERHRRIETMALVRTAPATVPCARVTTSISDLLDWHPDLVVECAGPAVVARHGPGLLSRGSDFMIASVGALADAGLRSTLDEACHAGRSRWITIPGAIGGLDALRAARPAGLTRVRYTGRKPPDAWRGSDAGKHIDFDRISVPTAFFEGNAGTSARDYPKNANVTAAIALAGLGFDATEVRLVADPTITTNVHELQVEGAFGSFELQMRNQPMPGNPRTSWLAALSVLACIDEYVGQR